MTNKLLLRRISEDDERALEDLFKAHSKWLFAIAFGIVIDYCHCHLPLPLPLPF